MTKFLCGECIHNSDKGGGCLIPKNLGYVDNCNRYLPKDRPIVQTNEEYLRSCDTEQLADFLTKVILDDKRFRMTMVGGVNETKLWLKQPHHSKE